MTKTKKLEGNTSLMAHKRKPEMFAPKGFRPFEE